MKVLIAATDSRYANGAAKCLIELSKELISRNYEVVVTLPRHGDIEQVLYREGIEYHIIRERGGCWISQKEKESKYYIKRFVNALHTIEACFFIKKEHIDIVHVNAFTAYIVGNAAAICHVPLVWHVREFMEEYLRNHFLRPKFSYRILNKADSIIAISEPIKEKWQPHFHKRIDVINDGLPICNYYVSEKTVNNKTVQIIIYGRVMPSKGQLFCIKGFHNIIGKINKDAKLFIAGNIEDENYFHEIEEYISANSLGNSVQYIGEIQDIKSLLKTIDITCVCSKREGFGRVTVESALAGCLVVGANTGATTEIINNIGCGIRYNEDS